MVSRPWIAMMSMSVVISFSSRGLSWTILGRELLARMRESADQKGTMLIRKITWPQLVHATNNGQDKAKWTFRGHTGGAVTSKKASILCQQSNPTESYSGSSTKCLRPILQLITLRLLATSLLAGRLPPFPADPMPFSRLPRTQDHIYHLFDTHPILDHRSYHRSTLSDPFRFHLHEINVCADRRGKIALIDHQQIRACDSRT